VATGLVEYVLLHCFNGQPYVSVVVNCSVLALSDVFCSVLQTSLDDMFITMTHCTTTSKESECLIRDARERAHDRGIGAPDIS